MLSVDCWTEFPNTHSLGSEVHPATNRTACQEACWTNNSCDGVDWNPGLPTGQQCWLIGPWTTSRQETRPDITQYVLNRTCGKLEHHTILHCVSKTSHLYNLLSFLHTQFDCDNFFGINVAEKAGNQNVLYFPTTPVASASTLPWETGNPEIASSRLILHAFSPKKHETHRAGFSL